MELQNRFQALDNLPVDDIVDINTKYQKVKEIFIETSKVTIGHKQRKRKEWISDETWRLIEERRMKKQEALDRDGGTLGEEYKELDRQVKKSVKKDKGEFVDNLGKEAQEAADRKDTRTVYKIAKVL